jgi:hypothetical protein
MAQVPMSSHQFVLRQGLVLVHLEPQVVHSEKRSPVPLQLLLYSLLRSGQLLV